MSFDLVRQVVETKFKADWGTRTAVDFGPNSNYVPLAGADWVRITTISLDNANAELGNHMTRQVGVIVVNIFVPKNTGEKAALDHATAVRDIFQNVYLADGLRTLATDVRAVGTQDKLWYQINAETEYRYDVFF